MFPVKHNHAHCCGWEIKVNRCQKLFTVLCASKMAGSRGDVQ